MKPDTIQFTVAFRTGTHGGHGDMPGVLDMLRYESGRVVDWGYSDLGLWVLIETERRLHQPDRWASFGLHPEVKA